jgi:hypothetical protein
MPRRKKEPEEMTPRQLMKQANDALAELHSRFPDERSILDAIDAVELIDWKDLHQRNEEEY